jgi:hypothetical protein
MSLEKSNAEEIPAPSSSKKRSTAIHLVELTWNGGPTTILVENYHPPEWMTTNMLKDMVNQTVYYPYLNPHFHSLICRMMALVWCARTVYMASKQLKIDPSMVQKPVTITTITHHGDIKQKKTKFIKLATIIVASMVEWAPTVKKPTEIPGFVIAAITQNGGSLQSAFPNTPGFQHEHLGMPIFQSSIWLHAIICPQIYINTEKQVIHKVKQAFAHKIKGLENKIKQFVDVFTDAELSNKIDGVYEYDMKKGVMERVVVESILQQQKRALLNVEHGKHQKRIANIMAEDKTSTILPMSMNILQFMKDAQFEMRNDVIYRFDYHDREVFVISSAKLRDYLMILKHQIEEEIKNDHRITLQPWFRDKSREIDIIEQNIIESKSFTTSLPMLWHVKDIDRFVDMLHTRGSHLRFIIDPQNEDEPSEEQHEYHISAQLDMMNENMVKMQRLYDSLAECYERKDHETASVIISNWAKENNYRECDDDDGAKSGVIVMSVTEGYQSDIANLEDIMFEDDDTESSASEDIEEDDEIVMMDIDEFMEKESHGEKQYIDMDMANDVREINHDLGTDKSASITFMKEVDDNLLANNITKCIPTRVYLRYVEQDIPTHKIDPLRLSLTVYTVLHHCTNAIFRYNNTKLRQKKTFCSQCGFSSISVGPPSIS